MIHRDSRQVPSAKNIDNFEMFLDSESLTDLRGLSDRVGESKVLVVMLSKSYLSRPWCLVELYYALEYSIPIVTVNIVNAGYDFEEAEKFLLNLNEIDKMNKMSLVENK